MKGEGGRGGQLVSIQDRRVGWGTKGQKTQNNQSACMHAISLRDYFFYVPWPMAAVGDLRMDAYRILA